jgi:hypothetical protein
MARIMNKAELTLSATENLTLAGPENDHFSIAGCYK